MSHFKKAMMVVAGAGGDVQWGARGVMAGGSVTDVMDYVTIQSTGNATDFGDLTVSRSPFDGRASNGSRGLWASSGVIDYVAIGSTGNATDFGDTTESTHGTSGGTNGTRALFAGGEQNVSPFASKKNIDYVAIDTPGNATDFGDLPEDRSGHGALGSTEQDRAIWSDGYGDPRTSYVTISSTGNAADFGDLTRSHYGVSGSSDGSRGVWASGRWSPTNYNTIDYITIATTGDATDFGDLTLARSSAAGTSDGSRGINCGGYTSPPNSNVIDYLTIASTGNSTDFGDITTTRFQTGATSGD
jgi:hypothetical protein|tara:strand:+ start:1060 stop:1962 length:903 start_codon:yes stop_codon:yes gene_type:complete